MKITGNSGRDTLLTLNRRTVLLAFAGFTAIGLLMFFHYYLDDLTRGHPHTLLRRLLEEMTGSYSAMVLFPFVVIVTRRFPWCWATLPQTLAVHLLCLPAFSFLHTSQMWVSRTLLFPLAGLGSYDYGIMSIRYFMEFAHDVIGYGSMAVGVWLVDAYRRSRDHQLAVAQLEARLAEARLDNLKLQLEPHFLFNTLNAVSSVMYMDVARADTMLTLLSDLLRRTLQYAEARTIPLEQEIGLVELYVRIMKFRLEEKLRVELRIDGALRAARVPQLLLQPLVENSIRHGADPGDGSVQVEVLAERRNGCLILQVADRGPGLARVEDGAGPGEGIGLSSTSERLRHLYGEAHRFTLENRNDGGLLVRIELPYEEE